MFRDRGGLFSQLGVLSTAVRFDFPFGSIKDTSTIIYWLLVILVKNLVLPNTLAIIDV